MSHNGRLQYNRQNRKEVSQQANYDKEVSFYTILNQNLQNEFFNLIVEIKESKLELCDKEKFIASYEKKLKWYQNNPTFYYKLDSIKIYKLKNLLGSYNAGKKTGALVWGSEKNNKKFQLKMQRIQEVKNIKAERLKVVGLGILPPKPKTNFQVED